MAVADVVSRETRRAVFGERLPLAEAFAELLVTVGIERGLVGPRESDRMWDRHLLNCAVLARAMPAGARVADVGSGAGLPGLVLAIARPDLAVHCIEPLLRRATFLTEAVGLLGLDTVTVLRSRAEEQAGRQTWDVVTARAVAPLDRLAAWCLPLVRPGGELLAVKGARAPAELAAATPTLRALGATSWSVDELGAGLVDPPVRVVRVGTAGVPGSPAPR